MRIESSVTAISWIPSTSIDGLPRLPFEVGVAHYDQPPPERLAHPVAETLDQLCDQDRLRIANHLGGWIETNDRRIVAAGRVGGGIHGSTTLHGVTVPAVAHPDIVSQPEFGDGRVTFRQSVGGHTGVPAPRLVPHRPFVQVVAPTAWSTLELTLFADGRVEHRLVGASPFPRHWIYDGDGRLTSKSCVSDFRWWYRHAFGGRTPWCRHDVPAMVAAVESDLERRISRHAMASGRVSAVRRLRPGEMLVSEGERGTELFLVLDGVFGVVTAGRSVAQVGPGAIVGERSIVGTGRRTSSLVATTDCRVVAVDADLVGRVELVQLSGLHRAEEAASPS